jgi:basic amino acid/polyamine antiporter, APA family
MKDWKDSKAREDRKSGDSSRAPDASVASDASSPHPGSPELRRELTLLDATMINVGSMIGSGIFIVPATIALQLHSSLPVMTVWIVGGIVSLFGALSVAELGAMMPGAGGQYVYLKEAYGPLWGFLYGWSAFTCINSASIAAIAATFALYLGYFFPMGPAARTVVAIASIGFLTTVNCFGIKLGAIVQNGFTFLKIGSLLLVVFLAFLLSAGTFAHFSPILPSEPFSSMAGPFMLAMIAALFAYDGWIEITYVAGEVQNPGRTIPRALFLSTVVIIGLYIAINGALIYVLPLHAIASSTMVVSDAAVQVVGSWGAAAISLAVILSTFGANNGFIITSPRIYYAMAKEGLFFTWLARIHPRYRTPVPSLIVQGIIASALVFSGTFDQLATYVVFASWVFYALSALAVILLRRRRPTAGRPYKTWGYPVTPILFVLFSLYLVGETIIEDPRDAAIGTGIILAGIPIYYFWSAKLKAARPNPE